jgi:hypothetical protein
MRAWLFVLALALLSFGCALPRAVVAVQEGRITLGASRESVLAAAGEPDLVLASQRVETLYYRRGEQAVSVSLLGDKVVAFSDSDRWPVEAAQAADDASEPVSTGKIRIGMTEQEVRAVLDEPDGVTAKAGVETLHWLSGDEVDSIVNLEQGKVVGFWDRPVSEFTQNLPTSERDVATTGGKIRVGMTMAEVQKLLGEPDGAAGGQGLITHRYESDPVFGDEIVYSVGYRDGRVVDLFEFNVSRDEEQKEEEEARRLAAEAAAQEEQEQAAIAGFLSNPLVQAALGAALVQGQAGQPAEAGQVSITSQTVQSSSHQSLDINGSHYEGSGPDFGRSCSPEAPCPQGYKCALITMTMGQCVQ